ncbi:MAG TPA: hypothetical protein VKR52_05790 [Terracidiphilus sp.]|nr:hypothetical protein [Terracidiphilus sp.]
MLKRLAILSLLLTCARGAWTQVPGNGSDQNQKPQGSQTQPQATQPSVLTPRPQQEPAKEKKNTNPKSSGYPWQELLAPANIPNWILAIIGVLGVRVALITLRKLERQTKGTEDAAEAALLNAKAVINAERGRILFEIEKRLDEHVRGIGIFTILAVNYGRSPVEIVGYTPPTEDVVKLSIDLPIPPQYQPEIIATKRYLTPGERYRVAEAHPSTWNAAAVRFAMKSGVSVNEQARIVYGQMRYIDGVSPEIRISRYCLRLEREPFRVAGGSLVPFGPEDYNKCT